MTTANSPDTTAENDYDLTVSEPRAAVNMDLDGDGDNDSKVCPLCQSGVAEDANYCSGCGTDLAMRGRDPNEPGTELRFDAPRRNLIRGGAPNGVNFREADDASPPESPGVLFGYFSTFDDWYEINSMWEGTFLERVAPGAFAETIANDRANMRSLYDHGMDPQLGNKPLGPIRTLEERTKGPYYEVDLLNTGYNRDFIAPASRGELMNGQVVGSQLSASFAFEVQEDSWNSAPKPSDYNARGIPERTILRAKVFEFGPVTFPANPAATAGMRSMSDAFMARLVGDQGARERFESRVGKKVAERLIEAVPADLRTAMEGIAKDNDRARRQAALRRRARLLVLTSA